MASEPMYNPEDVIAFLVPHESLGLKVAMDATRFAPNKARFLAGGSLEALKLCDIPSRRERGGTERPVVGDGLKKIDCLVLLFSHGGTTSVGLVLGSASTADIVIPKGPGISTFHLAFTFDNQFRLIARDLDSTGGTKVIYNDEKRERISNFDWLLTGPSIVRGKAPILDISDFVQFQVFVPHHDIKSPDYIDKVKRFREGTADPGEHFADLILHNAPGTRLPTGQKTPLTNSHSRPIVYQEELGRGAYGVVEYKWNVTTGDEYVVKRPLPKLIENKGVNIKSWQDEAAIMKSVSHVSSATDVLNILMEAHDDNL
jgi:hypothetical protein